MMQLFIGNKNYSSWSLRAWLVAKASGVAFEEKMIYLDQPETAREIRAVIPSGRVPALLDGDTLVWDSLAIAEYLAERVPAKHLWPKDVAARARARCICAEMHSGFASLRQEMGMHLRRETKVTPSASAAVDIDRVKEILVETRRHYGQSGAFLFGDFSIADAFYAPVITRFRSYGVPTTGPLAEYVDAVLNQSWMKEWYEAARSEEKRMMRYE